MIAIWNKYLNDRKSDHSKKWTSKRQITHWQKVLRNKKNKTDDWIRCVMISFETEHPKQLLKYQLPLHPSEMKWKDWFAVSKIEHYVWVRKTFFFHPWPNDGVGFINLLLWILIVLIWTYFRMIDSLKRELFRVLEGFNICPIFFIEIHRSWMEKKSLPDSNVMFYLAHSKSVFSFHFRRMQWQLVFQQLLRMFCFKTDHDTTNPIVCFILLVS